MVYSCNLVLHYCNKVKLSKKGQLTSPDIQSNLTITPVIEGRLSHNRAYLLFTHST